MAVLCKLRSSFLVSRDGENEDRAARWSVARWFSARKLGESSDGPFLIPGLSESGNSNRVA